MQILKKIFILCLLMLSFPVLFSHAEETPLLSVETLAIPDSLGKVETRFKGKTDYWVIHIQDVHAHFNAQENIAAIIDHLNHIYGIQTIGVEGGWEQTTFATSWGIPNSREKQLLARELLQRDYLTGSAHAALFSKTPITLVGIENEKLYEENRARFVEHLAIRGNIIKSIDEWKAHLQTQKVAGFNADLLKFDQALTEFREGKKPEKFLPHLLEYLNEKSIDFSDLEQVVVFEQIIAVQKQITKKKLESEAARIMKTFKQSQLNFEELLRSEKISMEQLEYYPATKKYMQMLMLQDKIDHVLFFEQIDVAIDRVKEKLFTSGSERELDQISERQRLAEKVILLQAVPSDIEKYENNLALIKITTDSYALGSALDLASSFYSMARKRDQVFFNKLQTDPKMQRNVALVTGGFHTEGLSRELRKAGISHIVITPELGDGKPDEELYFKRIRTELPNTQTIQTPLQTTFMHPRFDQAFFEALKDLQTTKSILKAMETLDRYLLGTQSRQKNILEAKISMEQFLGLSRDEQIAQVETWLDLITSSTIPIAIFAMQDDFTHNILYLQFLKANRHNRLGFVIPENALFHDESVGGKAPIKRIIANSLEEAWGVDATQRWFTPFTKKRTAAALSDTFEHAEFITLPPVDEAFLLARPLLEGYFGISNIEAVRNQFWKIIQEIVSSLDLQKRFVASA